MASFHFMAYITSSIEEANTLSTDLAIDTTLPKNLLLLGNETILERVIVSEETVGVLANILDEELTNLLSRGGGLFGEVVVVGLELASGSNDVGRLASTNSNATICSARVRHFEMEISVCMNAYMK